MEGKINEYTFFFKKKQKRERLFCRSWQGIKDHITSEQINT